MKKGGDFLSNLQRVGPGPEEGGERETETNRVKEKLTLGITPNQGGSAIQGMGVQGQPVSGSGFHSAKSPDLPGPSLL